MTSSPQSSPFVAFPAGNTPSSAIKFGPRPNLDFLGQSSAGDLYFNRGFTSLGLVCCSLVGDVEAVVKRLVAAHTGESDARVLIFYSDISVTRQKPCSLMNLAARKPKILISPRNLESSSRLYASAGTAATPLNLQESAITMQHLLDFFTPPSDMQGRSTILNTIQLIISQLREPFDLQYFIELVEKESWTDDGANFMALRQTILTSLLQPPNISLSPNDDIVIDLGDPILGRTGLDNVLMDMLLHQFLLDPSKRRQMLVFYNSHAYLSTGSPLSRSLESLATSGSNRPTSIILASTSPSSIPLGYCNSVDYVVYGHGRSSVWKGTLHELFSLELPTTRQTPGRLAIWSPDSQRCVHGHTEDPAQRAEVWEESQALIDVSELRRTTPQISEDPGNLLVDRSDIKMIDGNVVALASKTAPTRDTPSVPSPLDDEEEGMVPLSSMYLEDIRHKGSPISGVQYQAGAVNTPVVESAAMAIRTPVSTADSLPPATATSSTSFIARDASAFQPLISAITRVSNNQPDALVSFEAVRAMLGNNAAIKKLGWLSYTSFVEDARRHKLLDIIETSGGFKFIRLSPSPVSKSPPAIKVESIVANPLVPAASPKSAASTKVDLRSAPIINEKAPSSTTMKATLPPMLQICPAKHRPLVEAVLKLGMNNSQAKVSFDAVGSIVGKTKAEVQARGHGLLSYPHWVQKAQEDGWILQGRIGEQRWITLGSKLQPKPIAVTSAHIAPKVMINKPPAEGSDSGKVKSNTTEPMAGPSASPKISPKPNILDSPSILPTPHSHSNGPTQSNVEVRTAAEHSEKAISSPAAATTRRAMIPLQNAPNVTLTLAASRVQSHPSPASSVNRVTVAKGDSARVIDQGNSSMNKGNTSSVLPSPGQSRRVSVDSYPSLHRLVAAVMIALGSGSSHVQVTSERLSNALLSITKGTITTAELTSYIVATVEAGILKRFVNNRGETWFWLENPVQSSPPQGVATSWMRSLVPSWF